MSRPESPIPFIQHLRATAQAEGKSIETFVRDAINGYVAREQEKADPSSPAKPPL